MPRGIRALKTFNMVKAWEVVDRDKNPGSVTSTGPEAPMASSLRV